MNLENKQKLSEAFASLMIRALDNEADRHAVASKVIKYVQDDIQQRDLASLLLPRDFVPLGQTAEYPLRGKIKVYWHEPGSYAPRTRMTQKVFTVPVSMVSANLEYELGQLEAGRYGSIADQVSEASNALLGAINAKVWNTLVGSIATTDDNYGTSTSNMTKAALDNAINWVEDQNGGGARAIVGRRNVLYKLLDFNYSSSGETGAYSENTKQRIDQTGSLPTYRGIPVVGLPQWRDAHGKHTIAQDEVLVVGGQAGRYVVQQELRSRDAIDADTLIWNMHMYTRIGVAVFFPERIYRIKIV